MLQLDEFDYNKSRKDIEKYVDNLLKNEDINLETKLQNKMQEILANLLGCNTYRDATLESGQNSKYYVEHYHRLGKRKLSEFFIMLEEIEKHKISVEDFHFYPNKNTLFLKREIERENFESLYLDLLDFSNIEQFFNQVINIFENTPRNQPSLKKLHNSNIPDPKTFNLKNHYYESIDLFIYAIDVFKKPYFYKLVSSYNDNSDYKEMLKKHSQDGKEIDAIAWIKDFRNKKRKKHILNTENTTKTTITNKFFKRCHQETDTKEINDDDSYNALLIDAKITKDELKKLSQTIKSKKEEIYRLKEELSRTHDYFKQQLKMYGTEFTDKELEQAEETYILDKILETTDLKETEKYGKALIYSTFVTFTFAVIKSRSTYFSSEEARLTTPIEEASDLLWTINTIKNKKQTTKTTNINNIIITTEENNSSEPYYLTPTAKKHTGFTKISTPSIIVGYMALENTNDETVLVKSFRTEEEINEFMKTNETTNYKWRKAISTLPIEEIEQAIKEHGNIPYNYATYYIDYEPIKQKVYKK